MSKKVRSRKLKRGVTARRSTAGRRFDSNPPVLRSERLADFQALYDRLIRENKPRDQIEEFAVYDVACHAWEIVRLRRCRTNIINAKYLPALESLLESLLMEPGSFAYVTQARDLALNFFFDNAKEPVLELLTRHGLDESVIEGEAFRQSLPELERIGKLEMQHESMRGRALASLTVHRSSLAQQLRETSDQIILEQSHRIPRLENAAVPTAPE